MVLVREIQNILTKTREKILMITDYKEIDKLIGMCIEPGDIVKLPNNDIVTITRVEPTQDGYDLFFLDLFEDEELVYSLDDNQKVSLLEFD
jgi:hypothetical protein